MKDTLIRKIRNKDKKRETIFQNVPLDGYFFYDGILLKRVDRHAAINKKEEVFTFLQEDRVMLVERRGSTKGYAIAFRKNQTIFVGYAVWDGTSWGGMKFSNKFGRFLANERAVPLPKLDLNEIPQSARETVSKIVADAIRYFKDCYVPGLDSKHKIKGWKADYVIIDDVYQPKTISFIQTVIN